MAMEAHKKRGIQLLSMVEKGNLEGIQQLLQLSSNGGNDGIVPIDIDARYDGHRRSPLQLAIERGHLAIVQLLIDRGADVEPRDGYGWCCLQIAVVCNRLSILKVLLRQTSRELLCRPNYCENTPLKLAASQGRQEMVKLLLEYKADVNMTDYMGRTPLHQAARFQKPSIVRLLLGHGADINAKDVDWCTPLHFAVSNDKAGETIQALLECRPGLVKTESDGFDLLYKAMQSNNLNAVRLFLEHGLDSNTRSSDGSTFLHYLVTLSSASDMIRLFLESNADVDAVDGSGFTLLHIALLWNRLHAIELLLEYGADVNASGKHGYTPLHFATNRDRQSDMIETLIRQIGRPRK